MYLFAMNVDRYNKSGDSFVNTHIYTQYYCESSYFVMKTTNQCRYFMVEGVDPMLALLNEYVH